MGVCLSVQSFDQIFTEPDPHTAEIPLRNRFTATGTKLQNDRHIRVQAQLHLAASLYTGFTCSGQGEYKAPYLTGESAVCPSPFR
jgi:hypothetical protein